VALLGTVEWMDGIMDGILMGMRMMWAGAITRIKANFDVPGLFVWHCHILEQEDNEMMRFFYVEPMTLSP
jgi:FtsP/CotA-like multicopper oxidase with cupredoxin domain